MKQINKPIYGCLIALLFLLFMPNAKAQLCTSSASDNSHGPTATGAIKECGNDVWEDECNVLVVWVNSNGLAFSYTPYCSEGGGNDVAYFQTSIYYPYPYNIMESPDVSIVKNGDGVFYALCVFYNPQDYHYYLQTFKIEPVGLTTVYQATDLGATQLNRSSAEEGEHHIRIDANQHGDFVIIYEHYSAGYFYTVSGNFPTSSSDPTLYMSPVLVAGYSLSAYTQPDVAISESTNQGECAVFYTFVSTAGDYVYVTSLSYLDINGVPVTMPAPSVSPGLVVWRETVSSDYLFNRPRIACSNKLDSDDWTVVWENRYVASSPETSDIVGMSHYNSSMYPTLGGYGLYDYWNYTGGVHFDLPQLSGDQRWPCVSYDEDDANANGIKIAWWGDDLGSLSFSPVSTIIGVVADQTGEVIGHTCTTPMSPCYEVASYSPKTTQVYPSLAGRHSGRMNIAFFDDDYGTITEKYFTWCETFRPGNQNALNNPVKPLIKGSNVANGGVEGEISLSVSPNPSSSTVFINFKTPATSKMYRLTITDILGRQVNSITGNAALLNRNGIIEIQQLKPGNYFITVSDNTGILLTNKICRL